MAKFADQLKVIFFIGNNVIPYDPNNQFTKLEEDSSLYLDLNSLKDANLLHLLMNSDKVLLQGRSYTVVNREFMTDGTALYFELREVEGRN